MAFYCLVLVTLDFGFRKGLGDDGDEDGDEVTQLWSSKKGTQCQVLQGASDGAITVGESNMNFHLVLVSQNGFICEMEGQLTWHIDVHIEVALCPSWNATGQSRELAKVQAPALPIFLFLPQVTITLQIPCRPVFLWESSTFLESELVKSLKGQRPHLSVVHAQKCL